LLLLWDSHIVDCVLNVQPLCSFLAEHRYALGQFAAGYIDLKKRTALPLMFATSAISTMLCGLSSSVVVSALVRGEGLMPGG
jgi:hypothetical protein